MRAALEIERSGRVWKQRFQRRSLQRPRGVNLIVQLAIERELRDAVIAGRGEHDFDIDLAFLRGQVERELGPRLAAGPPELAAVCAVSPTMDLASCVEALERRANIAYEFNFVRNLKARMRRKARAFSSNQAPPRH